MSHAELEALRARLAQLERLPPSTSTASSEARYRLLIEKMNEGFAATDPENRFDLVNAKLEEMLGYESAEMVGRFIGDFVDDAERVKLQTQESLRQAGRAAPYELTWTAKDGRKVETVVSPTPLHDAAGAFVGSFAVVTDVTERRRAAAARQKLEEQMRETQKLESLGLLAGSIAHDFNNLLVGIMGNAGLALRKLEEGSELYPHLEQIQTAGQRAAELTKEILAFSGKGKLRTEAIQLASLVEEMANLLELSISKKVTLRLHFADELPAVACDATQIRQVIMNLITNASEAIGDRVGVIHISTGLLRADERYLAATYLGEKQAPGTYVYVEVSDTGPGMSEETRARIFEPFFTTKVDGRGLGLASVLGIVRSHGGALRVTSRPGTGTVFRVLFPASAQTAVVPSPSTAASGSYEGRGVVLVGDDEALVRGVARATLESVGFTVRTAEDGVAAVQTFRRHADEIVIVLLDLSMPRLGGKEALEAMRRITPGLKAILVSGLSHNEAAERFADLGLVGFLQKPFLPDQLIDAVSSALEPPTDSTSSQAAVG